MELNFAVGLRCPPLRSKAGCRQHSNGTKCCIFVY